MATLYISEYTQNTIDSPNVAQEPSTATQTIAVGAGSVQSTVFRNDTKMVRLHTDTIACYAFGTNPTATTSSPRMAANQTEYFKINPAFKVAIIAASA